MSKLKILMKIRN